MNTLYLVIPCYNEQEVLPETTRRLAEKLTQLMKAKNSLTADFLSGRRKIQVPSERRSGNGKFLKVIGAKEHNLKNVDVK